MAFFAPMRSPLPILNMFKIIRKVFQKTKKMLLVKTKIRLRHDIMLAQVLKHWSPFR